MVKRYRENFNGGFKIIGLKIKRISIGIEIPKQFHIGVGSIFPMYVDNVRINTQITSIVATEKYYLVYTKLNDEIQLWKRVPKNAETTEEFFID